MTILVTGAAGFIGSETVLRLLERGESVVGLDNHNDYYDVSLKEARLERHIDSPSYSHYRVDITCEKSLKKIFENHQIETVINLAAQAGVRHSIDNPSLFIQANVVGFLNILEICKHHSVKHLVYASSSSVYGANKKMPYSINDNVDHPLSLYAASKKTNELMAHTYSHLYNLPTTGLRFFTVYGPWGRPDMALFKFTDGIINKRKIPVFNYGNHKRDFTFIDDIVSGVIKVHDSPPIANEAWSEMDFKAGSSKAPWKLYNIGNNSPVKLMDYISAIESSLGITAKLELLPMQPGDVIETYADVSSLKADFDYKPATDVKEGVKKFVEWYLDYYGIE